MPQASAYINKIRADAEGRNTKKEYPGALLNQNYLGALMCTNFKQNGLFNPPWWISTKYILPCKCLSTPIASPLVTHSIILDGGNWNTSYTYTIDGGNAITSFTTNIDGNFT